MVVIHLFDEDTEFFLLSSAATNHVPESEDDEDHEDNAEDTQDASHQHGDEVILDTTVLP